MYYYTGVMNKLYLFFQAMGMDTGFLVAVLWIFHAFLFLVGSFFVLHLFCFSKDSVGLLYLPLKPEVLLFSKLLVVILSGYILALFLLVPPLILYGVNHFSAGYLIAATIIFFVSPMLPLTILGGFNLLVWKLAVVWKKKSPGYTAAVGHLLLLILAGFMTGRLLNPMTIEDSLATWSQLEARVYGFMLILYLGLSVISLYLFWLLGRRLFPAGLTLYRHSRRKWNAANMSNKRFTERHPFISYFHKEWRLFFREPVYVLNGLFGVVITPFLLPLSFQVSDLGSEKIRDVVVQEEFSFIATILALSIVVITSGIHVVASSSVSREGSHFWLCQLVPLPYYRQMLIKVAFAAVTSGIGLVLNNLIFMFYFGYQLRQISMIFILGLLFSLAWSALGVLIDVLHPKLNWVNQSEAVKQNKNVLLAILLNVLIVWIYYRFLTFAFANNWNEKLIFASVAVSATLLAAAALQGIVIVCRYQERHFATKTAFIEEGKK